MRGLLLILTLCPQDSSIDSLIEHLDHPDIQRREDAVDNLKRLGTRPEAQLRVAARSESMETARRARQLLTYIEAVRGLSAEFRKTHPGVVDRLAFTGGREWMEAFRDKIGRTNAERFQKRWKLSWDTSDLRYLAPRAIRFAASPEEAAWAGQVIARSKIKTAYGILVEQLKNPDPKARIAIADLIRDMRDPDIVPFLIPLYSHRDPGVRSTALSVVRFWKDPQLKSHAARLLTDSDENVRSQAAGVLGAFGEKARDYAPHVARLLGDASISVQAEAATALGLMRAHQYVDEVAELLKSPDGPVEFAAYALGYMEATDKAKELTRVLDHRSGRAAAIWALWAIRAPARFSSSVAPLLKDRHWEVRFNAARCLIRMRAKEHFPQILTELRPHGSGRIAGELAREQVAGCEDAIARVAFSKTASSRAEAVWALARFQDRSRLPEIRGLLKSVHSNIRGAAAAALAHLGDVSSIAAIQEARFPFRGEFLCRLGSESGMRRILHKGGNLNVINGIRQAPMWKHARGVLVPETLIATPRELWKAIQDKAGVEWKLKLEVRNPDWESREIRVWSPGGLTTLEEVLLRAFEPYAVILEKNTIRIVTASYAKAFWNRWWR